MKFSILIAHYNNAKYFEECYQSLISQTYNNWEAIIVDDASDKIQKEKLKEIIKNDSRFILVENASNRGVGFTKSRCINIASGDICGFVDPDDGLTPDALEKSIIEFQNENIIATYSKYWICDEHLTPSKPSFRSRKIRNGNPLFFNVRFKVTHFFSFRRDAYYETSGINEELTSAVDQDLYLKLYEIGNFKFIAEPLYLYRIHNKGVSQQKSKKDKLYENWHKTLLDTLNRRNIDVLFGKKVSKIPSLPHFIFHKRNTLIHKIVRKLTVW